MSNLYAIYFSATDTTSLCVNYICQGLGLKPTSTINLADGFDVDFPQKILSLLQLLFTAVEYLHV